jgi:hypothetical protein
VIFGVAVTAILEHGERRVFVLFPEVLDDQDRFAVRIVAHPVGEGFDQIGEVVLIRSANLRVGIEPLVAIEGHPLFDKRVLASEKSGSCA